MLNCNQSVFFPHWAYNKKEEQILKLCPFLKSTCSLGLSILVEWVKKKKSSIIKNNTRLTKVKLFHLMLLWWESAKKNRAEVKIKDITSWVWFILIRNNKNIYQEAAHLTFKIIQFWALVHYSVLFLNCVFICLKLLWVTLQVCKICWLWQDC